MMFYVWLLSQHNFQCSWILQDKSVPHLFFLPIFQFSSVQLLSHVRLFVTPWIAAHQASLSITNSRSSLRLMSIKSVMPSNHLILRCPLLLLPSIFTSIRVFSNESALLIRWPKYWSFSFKICPSSEHPGLISLRMNWLDLQLKFNWDYDWRRIRWRECVKIVIYCLQNRIKRKTSW